MYRLFIVEDEEYIRKGLIRQVPWNELGFDVAGEAENGEDALLAMGHGQPDVVLTDIRMPVMDGITLIEKLNHAYPNIKVVILSGYSEFEYAKKALEYGVSAYLLKPTIDNEIRRVFMQLKNELDEINTQRDLYKSIKEEADIAALLKKEKFFAFLADGRSVDTQTIYSRLDRLGIGKGGYFGVISFEPENIDKQILSFDIQKKAQLTAEMTNMLLIDDSIKILEILYPEEIMNIVLYSKERLNKVLMIKMTEVMKKSIISYFDRSGLAGCLLTAGIGLSYSDVTKISVSKEEAWLALSKKFYHGTDKIYHFLDFKKSAGARESIISNLNEEQYLAKTVLYEAVFSKDKDKIKLNVNKYFDPAEKSKVLDAQSVYVRVMELIEQLQSKLREEKIEIGLIKRSDDELFKMISLNKTLQDLKRWLGEFLIRVSEQIEEAKIYLKDKTIKQIVEYINENYFAKNSLGDIAVLTHMNPSYISTYFRQKTGKNLTEYITDVRIKKAKKLLLDRQIKVYEVASMVGYPDYRHFCKVFKKMEGITPVQYKNKK